MITKNTLKNVPLLLASLLATAAFGDCLNEDNLRKLDSGYEEALRIGDVGFLQQLLAEDYLWVHNLASDKETGEALIKRLVKPVEIPKSRLSSDISIHRLQNTAVLSGVSTVEKWNTDKTWRTMRYQFMRTYVKDSNNECKLLSTQTMKIWSDEKPAS